MGGVLVAARPTVMRLPKKQDSWLVYEIACPCEQASKLRWHQPDTTAGARDRPPATPSIHLSIYLLFEVLV